ncbi:MAG TPA: lytic transglycosylase domain-containing protein [Firmicutes bacterium]|nr:lytic transglycosylase domain-containing protein [Bacillota bacterium]
MMKKKIIYSGVFVSVISVFLLFYAAKHQYFWTTIGSPLYKDKVNKYAGEYKFDPLFVMAIMKTESNFQKKAKSHKGALGLMQLLPSTAEEVAMELSIENYSTEDLHDPETNIRIGFHYLSKLREKYGEDTLAVLAAYNAGMQRVAEWKDGELPLSIENIKFPETRNFVKNVMSNYERLQSIRKIRNLFINESPST